MFSLICAIVPTMTSLMHLNGVMVNERISLSDGRQIAIQHELLWLPSQKRSNVNTYCGFIKYAGHCLLYMFLVA